MKARHLDLIRELSEKNREKEAHGLSALGAGFWLQRLEFRVSDLEALLSVDSQ